MIRTTEELDLVGSVGDEVRVNAASAGYARRVGVLRGIAAWLGVRGIVHLVPGELRVRYECFLLTEPSTIVIPQRVVGMIRARRPDDHTVENILLNILDKFFFEPTRIINYAAGVW